MNTFPAAGDLRQYLGGSLFSLLHRGRRSTFWSDNIEKTAIGAMISYETKATLILKVEIPNIVLFKLDLQITPETLLIKGQLTAASVVEGYFRLSGFESLIPLPHPVQPKTCWADLQPYGVEIKFAKELRSQTPKHWIELST